jgi:hypothetical protein
MGDDCIGFLGGDHDSNPFRLLQVRAKNPREVEVDPNSMIQIFLKISAFGIL